VHKPIRTTLAQRETIALLKTQLAERGHFIFPVAPWYRRHRMDFVAVPKQFPQQLLVVRPMRDGSVSVRPFCAPVLYSSLRKRLPCLGKRTPAKIRWSNRQLPYARREWHWGWWHAYLSQSALREYRRLSDDAAS
jgi:hypothetical protein